jgi:ubiquinone biosynthesis protein COQ9
MTPPERSPERDAAIEALLPLVPFEGWTRAALRTALRDTGGVADDADLLFPGGVPDLLEAFCDLADRTMEAEAAGADMAGLGLTRRVRAVIAIRLAQNRPHKEAVRRAVALLALPGNAGLSARTAIRTVDSIWHAAGDRSADFSWYTKRAILASVYGLTLLYWLRDSSEQDEATLAFLDRRLAGVGRIGKLRGRAEQVVHRFIPRRHAEPA